MPKGRSLHLDARSYSLEDRGHETPCWVWHGAPSGDGYGRYWRKGDGSQQAHRRMYEKHRGAIPAGLMPDHLCRVRICVNPWHLELVTNAENQRRGARAVLTVELAEEIRCSSEPQTVIARRLGVHRSTVYLVRAGKTWR